MNEQLRKLYDALSRSGKMQGLPDFEQFQSELSGDPDKQLRLYQAIQQNNLIEGLPDFENFQTGIFGVNGVADSGPASVEDFEKLQDSVPSGFDMFPSFRTGPAQRAKAPADPRQPPRFAGLTPGTAPERTTQAQRNEQLQQFGESVGLIPRRDLQQRIGQLSADSQRFEAAARNEGAVLGSGEVRANPRLMRMATDRRIERDRLARMDTGQSRVSSYMGSFIQGAGNILGQETVRSIAVASALVNPVQGNRRVAQARLEAGNDPVYNMGEQIGQAIAETFPENPAYQKQMLTKLFQGGGTMAGILAGGIGGRALKLGSYGGSVIGGLSISGAEFDRAINNGATGEQAFNTWLINLPIGGLEGLVVGRSLKKIDRATEGGFQKVLGEASEGGFEELLQEVGQNFASNATARAVYDTTRQLSEGVVEGGAVGFVLGAFLRGVTTATAQRINNVKDVAVKSYLERAIEDVRAKQARAEKQGDTQPGGDSAPETPVDFSETRTDPEALPEEIRAQIDPDLSVEENLASIEDTLSEFQDMRENATGDTGRLDQDIESLQEAKTVLQDFLGQTYGRASIPRSPRTDRITDEAESLVRDVEEGGVPGFITERMRRIARENGVPITEQTRPGEVVEALKERSRFFGPEAQNAEQQSGEVILPELGTKAENVTGQQDTKGQQLSMAIKVGDQIFTAPRSEVINHQQLYDQYNIEDLDNTDGGGYMTPDGRYLTRDQATEYMAALKGEDTTAGRGVLFSEDFIPPPSQPEVYEVLNGAATVQFSSEGLEVSDATGNPISENDARYTRAAGEFFAKNSSPAGQAARPGAEPDVVRARRVAQESNNPVEIANTLADVEDIAGSSDSDMQNALRERFKEITNTELTPQLAQEIQTRTNRETPSMLAMAEESDPDNNREIVGEVFGDRIGADITIDEAVDAVDGGEFFSDVARARAAEDNGPKSRTTMVYLSPQEFLDLAAGSDTDLDTAVLQDLEDMLLEGGQLNDTPQLMVETVQTENGPRMKVVGHEGRHRSKVLLEAFEVSKIPVRVTHRTDRWGEKAVSMEPMPEQILAEDTTPAEIEADRGVRVFGVESVFYPTDINERNSTQTGREVFRDPDEVVPGQEGGRAAFGPSRITPGTGGKAMTGALDLDPDPNYDYEGAAVRVRDVIEKLVKALDLTVFTGLKKGKKNVMGTFDLGTGSIRMSVIENLEAMAHEAGHKMEFADPSIQGILAAHRDELIPLMYAGADPRVARQEGFAEFFRLYILNRGAAQQAAPNFFESFESWLESDPDGLPSDLKPNLDEVTAMYQRFRGQPVDATLTADVTMAKTRTQKFFDNLKETGPGQMWRNAVTKAYTQIIGEDKPLVIAVKQLIDIHYKNTGEAADLPTLMNFYKLNRLALDSYSQGNVDINFGVTDYNTNEAMSPALRDALAAALGKDWGETKRQEFSSYLIAKRAIHEFDRYHGVNAKGEKDPSISRIPNPPTKFNRKYHEEQIAILDERYDGAFAKGAEMVNQYTDALFRKVVDAGLVEQGVYEKVKAAVPFYVPFNREFFKEDGKITKENLEAQRNTGKNTVLNSFKGSNRPIIDPIESLMRMTYNFNNAIKQNDVKVALLKAIQWAGKDSAQIAEEIPAYQVVGQTVDAREVRKHLINQADWSSLNEADAIGQTLGVEIMDNLDFPDLQIFRKTDVSEKGRPIVYAMVDGKRRAIQINNTEVGMGVYNALAQLPNQQRNFLVNMLAYPAGILRTGITKEPSFFVANLVRDQLTAWVITDVGVNPFTSLAGDLKKRFVENYKGPIATSDEVGARTQAEYSRLYRAYAGISTFNTSALDPSRTRKEIESLKTKNIMVRRFKSVQGFNEALDLSEIGTRLTIFQRAFREAKKKKLTDKEASIEAAFEARDLIDFGRHGSRTEAARRLIPFFNAALQGLDKGQRVLRAEGKLFQVLNPYLKDVAGRPLTPDEQAQVKLGRKAWIKVGSLGTIGAMLASLYADDPDYDEIPDYLKYTHWILPDLWTDEEDIIPRKFVAIPKPFELAIISNTFESVIAGYKNEDPEWHKTWMKGVWSIMTPPISAPGVFVPFETFANKRTFDGRPIVYDRLQGLEPWRQYNAYASSFSKEVGKRVNVSPAIIDHTITGWTGSWGRDILALTTAVNPESPASGMDDMWIVRRFIRSADRGNTSAVRFYQLAAQLEGKYSRVANTFKMVFENDSPEEGMEYFRKLPIEEKVYVMQKYLPAESRGSFPGLSLQHPFDMARKATQTISNLRREIFGERSDTDEGERDVFADMSRDDKRIVDDVIDRLNTAYLRNSLIAAKDPRMMNRTPMDIEKWLSKLQTNYPDVYGELGKRFNVANAELRPQNSYNNFARFLETPNLVEGMERRMEMEMNKLVQRYYAD